MAAMGLLYLDQHVLALEVHRERLDPGDLGHALRSRAGVTPSGEDVVMEL